MMRLRFIVIVLILLFVGASIITADGPVEGRPGRAEARFLEGMIDHHQMALDMSNDCLRAAVSDIVRELCTNIIEAQQAEITQMQEWLLNWYNIAYQPVPMIAPYVPDEETTESTTDHNGHGMTSDAPFSDPPMMMGMMANLNRLTDLDYEIAWLEAMIDHHDDAIHMAQRILGRAQHSELIGIANAIITDQTAEIERIEALITELSE